MQRFSLGHRTAARVGLAALVFTVAGALTGCADELSEELDKNNPDAGTTQTGGKVTSTKETSGSTLSQINASDYTAWVYFELAGGKEVTPQNPQSSTEWDLAVQRFQVKVNGGISGAGNVQVALVTGTTFDALTKAPAGSYVSDQADSGDEDTEPDYAFSQGGPWYDYNAMTHVLMPKAQVYVVKSVQGAYHKVQITGYYDKAGSAGFLSLRSGAVTAP